MSPGEEAWQIQKAALREHGTYRKHFAALCAECDEAVRTISEALKPPATRPSEARP
jgi:hypothetical protein